MKEKLLIMLVTIFLFIGVTGSIIGYILLGFTRSDTVITGDTLNVKEGFGSSIQLSNITSEDRIYLVFDTYSRIEINARPSTVLKQLLYDVEGLPYDYENWLICQQRFLFIAQNFSSPELLLSFKDPAIPYAIKILEGEVDYSIFENVDEQEGSFIGIEARASTLQKSRFQQVMIIYPYSTVAEDDFRISGSLKFLEGKIGYAYLILITGDRNWLAYQLSSNVTLSDQKVRFSVDLLNKTVSQKTFYEDYGRRLQYVVFTFSLDSLQWPYTNEAYAKMGIGEVSIRNENETLFIKPYFLRDYPVSYKLYKFHKFTPNLIYILSLLALVFLVCIGALMIARLTGMTFGFRQFFAPLMTTRGESNPEPDTYSAKLSHKPRYDRLVYFFDKFAGKKVDVLIDVGCGKGILRKWLSKNGIDVAWYIGCDIDSETLHKNRNGDRVVCDVGHLPFRNKTAKVVTCSEVLEHVSYPYLSFGELLRISQRWIFFTFPDEKIKNALGFRYPEHISDLNESELKRLASKKGWKVIATDKIYSAFPPSVFDKIGLNYNSHYRTFVAAFFQTISRASRKLSLIKTKFLVLETSA